MLIRTQQEGMQIMLEMHCDINWNSSSDSTLPETATAKSWIGLPADSTEPSKTWLAL